MEMSALLTFLANITQSKYLLDKLMYLCPHKLLGIIAARQKDAGAVHFTSHMCVFGSFQHPDMAS